MTLRWSLATSSYSSSCLRMSKLRASTLRCALSMRRVDDAGLDGLALGHLQPLHDRAARGRRRRCASADLRATGRSATAPGSPWRPERPRSWLSMRRLSWRSVAMMRRPPSALTFSCRPCHSSSSCWMRRCLVRRSASASSASSELDLLLDVAAEHDVGAAAGHVGGDGDHARAAGLRDDLGLLGVLLGVEHLVRQLGLARAGRRSARSSRSTWCPPAPAGRARGSRGCRRPPRRTSRARSCRSGRARPCGWSACWAGSPPSPGRRSPGTRRPRCRPCRSCRPACRTCGSSSGR